METRDYLIALNMIEGLSTLKVRKLLEYYKSPSAIFKASTVELRSVSGINFKTARAISSFLSSKVFPQELNLIDKHKINIITIQDKAYPSLLRQIHDPPIVLYVKGYYLETDKLSLAVVGSRKSSEYGLKMARTISINLAKEGITIVSGLARGIDT